MNPRPQYPWKRYWIPQGEDPSMLDGFFVEPGHDIVWFEPQSNGTSLACGLVLQLIEDEQAPLALLRHVSRHALEMANRHPEDQKDYRIAQVAETLANAGDAIGASEVANRVENEAASRSAWRDTAIAYAMQSEFDAAFATVQHIQHGPERNRVVGEVFKAVLKVEDFDAAVAILNRCDDRVAAEFILAPMLGQALFRRESQQDAPGVVSTLTGAEAKSALLCKLAEEYATVGDAKRALATLDAADARVPRNMALGNIIKSLMAAGKHGELAAAVEELSNPDEHDNLVEQLAKVFAQAGDFAKGLAIALQLKRPLFRHSLMNQLVQLFPRQTKREQLRSVLEQTLDVGCRDLILSHLASDCSTQAEVDAEQAIAVALRIADEGMRRQELGQVADMLVRADQVEQIKAALDKTHQPIERSLFLSGMARGFISLEDAPQALACMRQIEDSQARCSALQHMACVIGRWEHSEQGHGIETVLRLRNLLSSRMES